MSEISPSRKPRARKMIDITTTTADTGKAQQKAAQACDDDDEELPVGRKDNVRQQTPIEYVPIHGGAAIQPAQEVDRNHGQQGDETRQDAITDGVDDDEEDVATRT